MSTLENISRVPAQIGNTNIAFVFSCPGSAEEAAGHVCAGKTGKNLEILIEYYAEQRPDVFTSSFKSDYTITNASDIVHYPALTNDSEASLTEISASENIERLKKDLRGCHTVICMGAKANYAVSRANIHARIVRGEHLSTSNLNRNYKVNGNDTASRNKRRVEIVGDKILSQL